MECRGKDEFYMDIMMLLDTEKVSELKREFRKVNEGLNLSMFVKVMTKFLKRSSVDELVLVANLSELFAQIDVNGDGTLEWDELTSFIVDSASKTDVRSTLYSIDKDGDHYGPYLAVKVVETLKKKYARIKTTVKGLKSILPLKKILVFEQDSSRVQICKPSLELCGELALPKTKLQTEVNIILDALYSQKFGYIVSSSESKIFLYDAGTLRPYKDLSVPSAQHILKYHEPSETLFSTGMNGIIHAWNISLFQNLGQTIRRKGAGLENAYSVNSLNDIIEAQKFKIGGIVVDSAGKVDISSNSHLDIILDILVATNLEFLVSCSMDCTIRLWDLHTGSFNKKLVGHKAGVRTLAYSFSYRLLLSGGFENDVFLWNPYIGNLVTKLSGHSSSILQIGFTSNAHSFISCDIAGFIRVWNLRNFNCIENISTGAVDGLKAFCLIEEGKCSEILCASKIFHKLKQQELKNPEHTHSKAVLKAIYNDVNGTIITLSSDEIKLWNARFGNCVSNFLNLNEKSDEFTSLCLDDRQRKFIFGTYYGRLVVCDYLHGSPMKETRVGTENKLAISNKSEITSLCYILAEKLILASCSTGAIFIYDENASDEIPLLRVILQDCEVNLVAFSERFSLICSFAKSSAKQVVVWDFEFGRLDAVCCGTLEQYKQDCLTFAISDFALPLLITSHQDSVLKFWLIRPALIEFRNKIILSFSLKDLISNFSQSDITLLFCEGIYLISGDIDGNITILMLQPLFQYLLHEIDSDIVKTNDFKYINGRRILSVDARKVLQASKNEFPFYEKLCCRFDVRLLFSKSFKCCNSQITDICLVNASSPPTLIISSIDGLTRLFSTQGEFLGKLQMRNLTNFWNFAINVEQRYEKKIQSARETLEQVYEDKETSENKGYSLCCDKRATDSDQSSRSSGESSPGQEELLDKSSLRVYERKTIRLKPVVPSTAGKGLSVTPRGRTIRKIL